MGLGFRQRKERFKQKNTFTVQYQMRLSITGSSGFVGTNFILHNTDLVIKEVDLLIQKVNDIDFTGTDSVLHLAALVHQMKGAPEEQYFKINRDLAYQVALKAKSNGVKHFVLMSTAKVYGESTTGKLAWSEKSECIPQDAYGKSKLEAEKLIKSLENTIFKVAIVRSPMVYGPGVKANMYNLVNLVHHYPILPLGGINNRRSMVYIGNLVALLQHILNIRASGIFIAGDRAPLSTTELTKLIANGFPKKVYLFNVPSFLLKWIHKFKPSILDRLFGSLELDNSKTNLKLGYIPPYSSEDGIREMVRWFKHNKNFKSQ
jgi:nucleoside-diphosphate-sugar epimerase